MSESQNTDSNEKYLLQSVTNALRVIELLGEFNNLTLTEITEKLELGKSSVFRLVATLESKGFVKKDKYGRCRLGMKFSYFGSVVLSRMEIIQASRLHLEELERSINETIHLAIWDDDWNIRFIDKIQGGLSFNMQSFVGLPKKCYSTATGKSMLAFMDSMAIEEFLQNTPLEPMTTHTITDPQRLLKSLSQIRETGVCISVEEDEVGLSCIGAPVFDISKKPIAAISISGPTVRIMDHVSEYSDRVLTTAQLISDALT